METQFIVAISIIGGVLCLLLVLSFVFKSVRNKLESYIQKRFDKNEIIGATTRANFFGEKSKGGKQIRGNGAVRTNKKPIGFYKSNAIQRIHIINRINYTSINAKFI